MTTPGGVITPDLLSAAFGTGSLSDQDPVRGRPRRTTLGHGG